MESGCSSNNNITYRKGDSLVRKIWSYFSTYAFAYNDSIENYLQSDRIQFSHHAIAITV